MLLSWVAALTAEQAGRITVAYLCCLDRPFLHPQLTAFIRQRLIGHANVQAIVLADKHSVAAAKELSTVAVARHPHSKALAKRHAALRATPAGPASKSDANL